ncbi:DUF1549 domain-containing protein [bacterium]|nr:DUF1549 domain-containing protein [bacterium]
MANPAKILLVSLLLHFGVAPLCAAEKFSNEQLAFFEKKIRPVLADKCHKCHSVTSKKLKADLYLDTREGLLKGGDSGPALFPGDPERSLLIEVIRYEDTDMEMPPKSKLPDAVIADFETWVKNGAAWPDEAAPTAGDNATAFDLEKRKSEHWSWKPLAAAPRAPGFIDQLVGERLKEAKLRPAPHAEPSTLLRRLTFDLTGLPPTPQEIDEFKKAAASNLDTAVKTTVDRLLASPHFGERWGRHWLDLMRYAETHGHEFDYPIHNAHQYRDYVIRALNADVPYDLFVAEHIAGDLLPKPRLNPQNQTNESIIATGFWYLGEAVHAPTDVRLDEANRIDNMVDTFSKSFLGLSIACARCHDHKFDAISTADYYALTGFLQSTRRNEHKQDPGQKIATGISEIEKIAAAGNKESNNLTVSSRLSSKLPDGLLLPTNSRWFTSGHAFGDSYLPALTWNPIQNTTTEHAVYDSSRYGDKLHGVLRTPTFEITGDRVHLYVKGNAKVQLIIDGYFMSGFNGLLFGGMRKDIKTGDKWQWITLSSKDIAQKAGQKAYLEIIDNGGGSVAVMAVTTARDVPKIDQIFPPNPVAAKIQEQFGDKLTKLSSKAKELSNAIPSPAATILSVTDGTPENDSVHIRGSHKNLGKEVPRRFLTALGGEEIPPPSEASGRLELAEQVVSRTNPLTARVAANRIWHHLFGRGIVPTIDALPSQAPRLPGRRSHRKQMVPKRPHPPNRPLQNLPPISQFPPGSKSPVSRRHRPRKHSPLQGSRPTPSGRSHPRLHARHLRTTGPQALRKSRFSPHYQLYARKGPPQVRASRWSRPPLDLHQHPPKLPPTHDARLRHAQPLLRSRPTHRLQRPRPSLDLDERSLRRQRSQTLGRVHRKHQGRPEPHRNDVPTSLRPSSIPG